MWPRPFQPVLLSGVLDGNASGARSSEAATRSETLPGTRKERNGQWPSGLPARGPFLAGPRHAPCGRPNAGGPLLAAGDVSGCAAQGNRDFPSAPPPATAEKTRNLGCEVEATDHVTARVGGPRRNSVEPPGRQSLGRSGCQSDDTWVRTRARPHWRTRAPGASWVLSPRPSRIRQYPACRAAPDPCNRPPSGNSSSPEPSLGRSREPGPHLRLGDPVPPQLHHGEIALAQRALDVVEPHPDRPALQVLRDIRHDHAGPSARHGGLERARAAGGRAALVAAAQLAPPPTRTDVRGPGGGGAGAGLRWSPWRPELRRVGGWRGERAGPGRAFFPGSGALGSCRRLAARQSPSAPSRSAGASPGGGAEGCSGQDGPAASILPGVH